jgi:DnaJ family protein C protein 17
MAPTGETETVIDYYELLSIPATASESEIRRAYRKTSLLYHPDKVTPTPENLEKFQLLQTAINILSDAAEKAKYDQTREAKQRRQAETAALEGRRRKMKEDLEKRETGAPVTVNAATKRTWSDREIEIKRIAEENRKRREAATVRKMQDVKAAEEAHAEPRADAMDRSVKVRWVKAGDGLDIDDVALTEMFPSGEVENVVILKDKKRKLEGREKKVIMGTAVLVFKSIASAKKVLLKGKTEELESVEWAAEKEKEAA